MPAPKNVWLRCCSRCTSSSNMRWKINHRPRATWTNCWMKWNPSAAMRVLSIFLWTRQTMTTPFERRASVADRIKSYLPYTQARPEYVAEGRLLRMVGLTLEAVGCKVPIGGHCTIRSPEVADIEAEVVGFSDQKMYLMPIEPVSGVQPGARVIPNRHVARIPVGYGLLGRILDGRGQPLDRKGPLQITEYAPLHREAINPLERKPIDEPLDVGVRAINSVLTVGRGQRMGLFAGSGVGKSVLLVMMTRFTSADITVVGLIGERGREGKEFIEHSQ